MERNEEENSSEDEAHKESYLENISAIQNILKDCGITKYDPAVLNQLLNIATLQSTAVLKLTQTLCDQFEKPVEKKDVKLALQLSNNDVAKPPSKKLIQELASELNSKPLPIIEPCDGLQLPPEKHCLLEDKMQLKKCPKPAAEIMEPHDLKRSYTIDGKSCIIRHNAEGTSRMRPMQSDPRRSPKNNKNLQDIPSLCMNASVTPSLAGGFRIPQTPNCVNWTKIPTPTGTAVCEHLAPSAKRPMISVPNSTYLKIPEFTPWRPQPTATRTHQQVLAPQVRQPLLPLSSVSPGCMPWTCPLDMSTHGNRPRIPLLPSPMPREYYQPEFISWISKSPVLLPRGQGLNSPVKMPLPGQHYMPTPAPRKTEPTPAPRRTEPTATVTREEHLTPQGVEPLVGPWTLDPGNLRGTMTVEINKYNFPISWMALTATGKPNTAETGKVDSGVTQEQHEASDSTPKTERTLEEELSAFLILKPKEQKPSPPVITGSAKRKRKRPCKRIL